ncbi:MAG: type 4a pilus biogenesis protein PilO [Trueperaceae bacterium]|nr:type 4a pilus biogenesis protein PilO [Trueperaceae bacterium]
MGFLSNLRQRDWAFISIGITILIGVGWYFLLFQPTEERIVELRDEISRLELEIQRGEAARRNLPELRLAVAQLEEDRLDFLSQLPRESEVAQLLIQIRQIATDSGITLNSINRGSQSNNIQGARSIGFNISTSGTYPETLAFLQSLESLQRFTKIEQVSFSGGGADSDDPEISSNYTFSVFVFTGEDVQP